MLVPTSVTTRLTSRLAVSFPTVGPLATPPGRGLNHQKRLSILSLPGRACIQQNQVSETTSVAIGETIRPVLPLGLRRRPATPLGARGPSRDVDAGRPRPHRPLRVPPGKTQTCRSRVNA